MGKGALGNRKSETSPPPGYYSIENKDKIFFHRSQEFKILKNNKEVRSTNVSIEQLPKEKEKQFDNQKQMETKRLL